MNQSERALSSSLSWKQSQANLQNDGWGHEDLTGELKQFIDTRQQQQLTIISDFKSRIKIRPAPSRRASQTSDFDRTAQSASKRVSFETNTSVPRSEDRLELLLFTERGTHLQIEKILNQACCPAGNPINNRFQKDQINWSNHKKERPTSSGPSNQHRPKRK